MSGKLSRVSEISSMWVVTTLSRIFSRWTIQQSEDFVRVGSLKHHAVRMEMRMTTSRRLPSDSIVLCAAPVCLCKPRVSYWPESFQTKSFRKILDSKQRTKSMVLTHLCSTLGWDTRAHLRHAAKGANCPSPQSFGSNLESTQNSMKLQNWWYFPF